MRHGISAIKEEEKVVIVEVWVCSFPTRKRRWSIHDFLRTIFYFISTSLTKFHTVGRFNTRDRVGYLGQGRIGFFWRLVLCLAVGGLLCAIIPLCMWLLGVCVPDPSFKDYNPNWWPYFNLITLKILFLREAVFLSTGNLYFNCELQVGHLMIEYFSAAIGSMLEMEYVFLTPSHQKSNQQLSFPVTAESLVVHSSERMFQSFRILLKVQQKLFLHPTTSSWCSHLFKFSFLSSACRSPFQHPRPLHQTFLLQYLCLLLPAIHPFPLLAPPSERSSFIYDFLMGTPCELCSLQSSTLACLRHSSLVYLGFIYHDVSSPTSPPTRFCQLYWLRCS